MFVSKDISRRFFEASVDLASNSYLDRLDIIYRTRAVPPKRAIDPEVLNDLCNFLEGGQLEDLAQLLLNPKKVPTIPFDHSYAALARQYPGTIRDNPGMVRRIGEYVVAIGFTPESLRAAFTVYGKSSRSQGAFFKNWVDLGMPSADGEISVKRLGAVDTREKGPWVLKNKSDKILGLEASRLGFKRQSKGLDLVAKTASGAMAIGEAKWVGVSGGNQDGRLRELLEFTNEQSPLLHIAILDGFPWVVFSQRLGIAAKTAELLQRIETAAVEKGQIYISALLLPNLLQEL